VDQKRMVKLYANTELNRYITDQARRHFKSQQDQEDARQAAWEKIQKAPFYLSDEAYKKLAYQAINAMYKRMRRLWQHESVQPELPSIGRN
jgi:hypothetical protein